MGKGAISWSSKTQQIVALSRTEAEYVALTHVAKEGLWLQTFLGEICGTSYGPMLIHYDNQGAIALSKDNKFRPRMKHIDIPYHFIHENVTNCYVPNFAMSQ